MGGMKNCSPKAPKHQTLCLTYFKTLFTQDQIQLDFNQMIKIAIANHLILLKVY